MKIILYLDLLWPIELVKVTTRRDIASHLVVSLRPPRERRQCNYWAIVFGATATLTIHRSTSSAILVKSTHLLKNVRLVVMSWCAWLRSNRLKLNADKTERILMITKQRRSTFTVPNLTVEGSIIVYQWRTQRRCLFWLQSGFKYQHISHICWTCYFRQRQLRTVRCSLPPYILKTLLHAFVSCRLDYCNSLFSGLPARVIARLQSVQNTAARRFGGTSKFESVQPALRDALHWLPVGERSTFKVALLTYRALHGLTPSYLTGMLVPAGKQSSPISKSVCRSWRLGCASCKEHQLWRPQVFDSCTKAVEQQLISDNVSYQSEDISIWVCL